MDKKGQGALEYLLIIGGAVLVAAITIALITGTTAGQRDTRAQAKCALYTSCTKCVAATAATDDIMVNKCLAQFSDTTAAKPAAIGATCTVANDAVFKFCDTSKTV